MMRRPVCASLVLFIAALCLSPAARAADVFVRFKVLEPAGEKFTISAGGWRHADPWYLPSASVEAAGGQWSPWLDVSKWPWHGKMRRAGGVAEWPAMSAAVSRVGGDGKPIAGSTLEVQLADKADEGAVVHRFTEKSGS